ncbi:helix-turn-helix transcriptional regulator [Photobacterium damselae]|uniref:helix-turn-helix transcriptional regulator n=1 Tax=Photobacterium damselae TaxID=38293 RepID=UPI004067A726
MNQGSFCQYIKQARIDAGLSQTMLARQLKIARQTYLNIESGKIDPRSSLLWRISLLTKKPIGYFFGINKSSTQSDCLLDLLSSIPEPYQQHFVSILINWFLMRPQVNTGRLLHYNL